MNSQSTINERLKIIMADNGMTKGSELARLLGYNRPDKIRATPLVFWVPRDQAKPSS